MMGPGPPPMRPEPASAPAFQSGPRWSPGSRGGFAEFHSCAAYLLPAGDPRAQRSEWRPSPDAFSFLPGVS